MLRMLVRSVSLVAILAGTAAAAGDPLPAESPAKVDTGKVETTKAVKKKSPRKAKKKAARKSQKKKQKKAAKRAAKASKAEAPT